MGQSRCLFMKSSVGKKQIMAVTGLMLCGFLITHLIGNCLIYAGPDVFNRYGHMIITSPFLYPAEFILFSLFALHLGLALRLTIENHNARPQKYYMKVNSGRGANFASSTMPYTGAMVLFFLIWHIITVKFGPHYTTNVGGTEMRDLYKVLAENFSGPLTVFGYVVCVSALGIHVSHGLWSALQSLGINHPKYTPKLILISRLFGIIVALGYSALPIYLYLQGGK